MAISFTKTLPKASTFTGAYSVGDGSGSDSIKITLAGVQQITPNTKKDLIKIKIPRAGATQSTANTDVAKNMVVDLQKVEDTIKIKGWLEDTPANDSSVLVGVPGTAEVNATTAWEKYWILRAMCSRGGALSDFTIDNVSFNSSTQEAFLEEVSAIINPTDIGFDGTSCTLNTNAGGTNVARIEVDLSIYLGDDRYTA